jgi:cullin 4
VARDEEMMQRLLEFKALADKAINFAFVREKDILPPTATESSTSSVASTSELPDKLPDQDFIYALTDAFAVGFKARRNKPAEMIAKYLDKAMRKGQGSTSDADFQGLLDSALALYRFTDDKDVFRTFYHRSLAKRLLLDKTASDDFEIAMLKKLKHGSLGLVCFLCCLLAELVLDYDPQFGMGEDMFKDLALSREAVREYHSKLPEDSVGRLLTAMVLQRSAWPFTAQKHTVDLPPNVSSFPSVLF